jgi:TIR domain
MALGDGVRRNVAKLSQAERDRLRDAFIALDTREWAMSGSSSGGIFLSYRREDAAPYARLLQFQLTERFPDAHVFMDLDSIEAGLDFAKVIEEAVNSCLVLVALIGRQWATLADEEGHRRLDDPNDYVRFEVQTALGRGMRVIPVLVDGARPLRRQQLPEELHSLARLNAFELSYDRYQYDADRLLDVIQRVLATAPSGGDASQSSSAPGASTSVTTKAYNIRPGGDVVGESAQQESPEPARRDFRRVTRLLSEAERIAHSITNELHKAFALLSVAKAWAGINPDRATRLLADAERAAKSISDKHVMLFPLTELATRSAAIDPDRAARLFADAVGIAESLTDDGDEFELSLVASALAATDPDGAERIAQSITAEDDRASVLLKVAKALAATEPDRAARLFADAEDIAESHSFFDFRKVLGRIEVSDALADIDPDRAARLLANAERIARSSTDKGTEAWALTYVASALAPTEPSRAARLFADAVRVAESLTDEDAKAKILARVADGLPATDPGRAERIARSLSDEDAKGRMLANVADALAATDPHRAERIAQSITEEDDRRSALAAVAKTLAATDPHRAERIAQSITEEDDRASVLLKVAEALATTDPDRAVAIAESIPDRLDKASALAQIAEAQIQVAAARGSL